MASEIKLPPPGEGLETVAILDVKVRPGDVVNAGQSLLEIEAEKSTVEVPAPHAGRIAKVLVKKGDQVQVGQTLFLIEESQESKPEASQAKPPPKAADGQAQSKPSRPAQRSKAAEEEPANGQEPAPAKAAAAESSAPEASPTAGNGRLAEAEPQPSAPVSAATAAANKKVILAGPATRRLARELGVDLQSVGGSGRNGRILQDDVKAYVRRLASGAGAISGNISGVQPPKLPDFEKFGTIEYQPLDRVRRLTAQQTSLAWGLIPHVTQHDDADVTDLEAFRKGREGQGPKLTMTAFALKAAAIALKEFPQFNASLDMAGGRLVLKRYYHIGVAVDTDFGLLVPVIRDVDKKSVQELAQDLLDVSERARQGKADMSGGCFTISNLGGIGGTGFTPIVNYPEVAILGLSRARLQPVVRDGQVAPRLILPMSLSYDHRVIDGAAAARFTRRLAEMLENPWLMLVQA